MRNRRGSKKHKRRRGKTLSERIFFSTVQMNIHVGELWPVGADASNTLTRVCLRLRTSTTTCSYCCILVPAPIPIHLHALFHIEDTTAHILTTVVTDQPVLTSQLDTFNEFDNITCSYLRASWPHSMSSRTVTLHIRFNPLDRLLAEMLGAKAPEKDVRITRVILAVTRPTAYIWCGVNFST